jgi:low affinity Fe/Cu permease
MHTLHSTFRFARFARSVARLAGRPATFVTAVIVIAAWAISGPLFGFSDTWQLVINTATTIITFLMVFLIQNTQNRDAEAIHVKLDELIRASVHAHNSLIDLEELSDEELERVVATYQDIARRAREELGRGGRDTQIVEVGGGERRAIRRRRKGARPVGED